MKPNFLNPDRDITTDPRKNYLNRHGLKQFKIDAKIEDIEAFKEIQKDKGFKNATETFNYLVNYWRDDEQVITNTR